MHASVRGVLVVLLLGTAPRVDAQTSEPLRKTDLIRLLSGGALSHREIADLIGRNCVSFTPTTRDRIDLAALGADSLMLCRIATRSEEHTSELQSPCNLVCRLLLEKKKNIDTNNLNIKKKIKIS